jgi:hypothetical protein
MLVGTAGCDKSRNAAESVIGRTGEQEMKNNNCITTYTRRRFNTLEPDENQIVIEDIAHALSMMTRANGHFPEFFSVGQHSIQCCREALARNYVPEVALACLLHDASEAYLSDVTRPVKKNMPMYLQIEEQLQGMIYHKFLGHAPGKEEMVLVSNIDDACLYVEFLHFMSERIAPEEPVILSNLDFSVRPMKEVEQEFLDLFEKLDGELEKR